MHKPHHTPHAKGAVALAVVAFLVAPMIAGCGTTGEGSHPANASNGVATYKLPDGRTVTCIKWDGGSYAGGLSCDWENAR